MGLAGFGIALVALAFLPYLMSPADAIVLTTLYAAVFALAIFVPVRRDFTPARVADLILGTVAGTPLGVWALTSFPASVLTRLIGLMLLVAVALHIVAAVQLNCQDVVADNHAEVAVERFGRVKKERGRAGAGERGGDFAADEAGFAESGDDDAALALEEQLDGAVEAGVEAVEEALDGLDFDAQDAARGFEAHEGLQVRTSEARRESLPRSGRRWSSGRALVASERALGGFSWTSRKRPSTPVTTTRVPVATFASRWEVARHLAPSTSTIPSGSRPT